MKRIHQIGTNTSIKFSQVRVTPNLATPETPFFHLWQRSKPTITPTPRADAAIPRWSIIWVTQPGSTPSSHSHCQGNTGWKPLQDCPENQGYGTTIFQTRWQSLFKKQTTSQIGSQMETWIQDCLYWVQWTLPTYWKSSYWKNKIMQCQRCSTQTTSGTMEHWHTVWQSWKIH